MQKHKSKQELLLEKFLLHTYQSNQENGLVLGEFCQIVLFRRKSLMKLDTGQLIAHRGKGPDERRTGGCHSTSDTSKAGGKHGGSILLVKCKKHFNGEGAGP